MLCPKCGTENPETNAFCLECGTRLKSANQDEKKKERKHIGIETIRVILFLFGLVILKILLSNMSFLEDVQTSMTMLADPQVQLAKIRISLLIDTIIDLVVICVLLIYSGYLRQKWPIAFPRFNQAVFFFQTAIYLIAMTIFYDSTLWLFEQFVKEQQLTLIYQLLFGLVAVFLLIRACVYFYQVLPTWLFEISRSFELPEGD